uniref:DHA14-like major facilitator n=1 Tax=Ganoderma boninense TaxID=34458 RepID=A0A5K1JYN2_9APHY|nr:DHA14-like major facilitator [Ganoderma boninense]
MGEHVCVLQNAKKGVGRPIAGGGHVAKCLLTVMNAMCVIPQAIVEAALFETFATVLISPLTAILTCRFLLDLHHANRAAASGPTSVTSTLFSGSPASLSLHFAGGAESQPPEGGGGQTATRSMRSSNHAAPLPAFIASMGEQVHMHLGQPLGEPTYSDEDGIELTSSSVDSGLARRAEAERWGRMACESEDHCELPVPRRPHADGGAAVTA